MRTHKLITAILTLTCAASISANAQQLNWQGVNDGVNGFGLWDQGGVGTGNLLTGGTDYATGFFVQLIHAGGGVGQAADPAVLGGTGAGGNDVVVDTTFVGSGFVSSNPDGAFNGIAYGFTADISAFDNFFLRIWNAPSPDGVSAPTVSTSNIYYGDSEIYTIVGAGPTSPPFSKDFTVSSPAWPAGTGGGQGGANGVATDTFYLAATAVPEPGTLALLTGGMLAIWLRRRKMNA